MPGLPAKTYYVYGIPAADFDGEAISKQKEAETERMRKMIASVGIVLAVLSLFGLAHRRVVATHSRPSGPARRSSTKSIVWLLSAVLVAIVAVGAAFQFQWSATTRPDAIAPAATPEIVQAPAKTQPANLVPGETMPKSPNYLSTSGSNIVDSFGHVVRLTGVNWFGMETQTFSPHGLWARNWKDMLDQIAALGFNTIRLPYSSTILDPNAIPMEGIDYDLNPDLKGLTGLEIMDKIVEGAGGRGMKIILDRHRPDAQAQSKLWYTDFLPEAAWISDWQALAKRYLGNDTVIGADLHNEPAGRAQWGGSDPSVDWRSAAERAGNAILSVNPNWLIIVEGVENVGKDGYWMGGNLSAAGQNPVKLIVPGKLVYSAHDYGPGVYNQQWFQDTAFPANLPAIWSSHWAYLVEQGIAPVIIGEFGGKSVSATDKEGIWQRSLLSYLNDRGISFTYWSFNPNSTDTGGILRDDWVTTNADKEHLLGAFLTPGLAVNHPDVVDRSAVATFMRQKPLPDQPIKVQLAANGNNGSGEMALKLLIVNQTAANVPLPSLELRYWLSPAESRLATVATPAIRDGNRSAKGSVVGIDWSSTDGVTASLVGDAQSALPYLKVTFGKGAGVVPSYGNVEVQLRVTTPDKSPLLGSSQFSFKASNVPTDNDKVALYFWGTRVWGLEPSSAAQSVSPASGAADVAHSAEGAGKAVAGLAVDPANAYVVKAGDTLRSVAVQAYGSESDWRLIAVANAGQIKNPDHIQVGQTLLIPVR